MSTIVPVSCASQKISRRARPEDLYPSDLLREGLAYARQFRRGTKVRHPQFGVGQIEEVTDMGQHTRAVVEFSGRGKKTLILQYARLEVVG